MKVVIVSTFRRGNLNIGDRLITKATGGAIKSIYSDLVEIDTVFRAEAWSNVKERIESADFVVFACLAIRKNLSRFYRFLPEVIASGVPYGVLAAGTSLNVSSRTLNLATALTAGDIELLRQLASNAKFFTTRGALSQAACQDFGIGSAVLAGDVAFVDDRFCGRKFEHVAKVGKIAISDPHYSESYKDSFLHLVKRLSSVFPEAEINLLMHGVNDYVKNLAEDVSVAVLDMYRDSEAGLDLYDNYDLHVGYRVHGHVSALLRRKPSYLLEQDGRGCDYGLTMSRKVSVPHYRPLITDERKQAEVLPVDLLMALLEVDKTLKFNRFLGMEEELRSFSERNLATLKQIKSS